MWLRLLYVHIDQHPDAPIICQKKSQRWVANYPAECWPRGLWAEDSAEEELDTGSPSL